MKTTNKSINVQGADHANGGGDLNPSNQDKDKNSITGKTVMKATASYPGMKFDGGVDKWGVQNKKK